MSIKESKQRSFAQNFLKRRKLVQSIVKGSSVCGNDLVVEIGPGNGIITSELAHQARVVLAIEKDPVLARKLKNKFSHRKNIKIIQQDFLKYRLSQTKYKVFANIPFNITARLMRQIFFTPNRFARHHPEEAYLIMQREAAQKYAGTHVECQLSILLKPWFHCEISRTFCRDEFTPVPNVDVVLLHMRDRKEPLIFKRDAKTFRRFIEYGFRRGRRTLKSTYRNIFTTIQWRRMGQEYRFDLASTPTQLTFKQWMGLFHCLQTRVSDSKKYPFLHN